jgi:hypothetical protein
MRHKVIADYIARNYTGKVVEVGIGRNWNVASLLVEKGIEVIAVDLFETRAGKITYVKDDITKPNLTIYQNASLIYSIRPPPELFQHIIKIAEMVKADCIIRPFSNEFPQNGKLVNYMGESFYLWKF